MQYRHPALQDACVCLNAPLVEAHDDVITAMPMM